MPAKDGKVDWQSGVGTGPYSMVKYEPGVVGEGKRYANYHRETYFDEIEVRTILDVAARRSALRVGQCRLHRPRRSEDVGRLESSGNAKLAEVAGFAHYVAPMITTMAPFDNKDVRLALKYAIDREEIVKKVLLGHGTAGNDNPIAPGVPFSHDPATKHVYDPEKVKFHLKKAGLEPAQSRPLGGGCGLCRRPSTRRS